MSSVNMDIRQSNNARVEMAIADFFHAQIIPDAVVDSPEFKRLYVSVVLLIVLLSYQVRRRLVVSYLISTLRILRRLTRPIY